MNKLQGKIAIVTGVSREGGIGAAICRALANEGASLFFTHLCEYDQEVYPGSADEHWPNIFAQELWKMGVQAAHMKLDLAQSGDRKSEERRVGKEWRPRWRQCEDKASKTQRT